MAYAQKIVMTKSGSNWNDVDEALQEIQSDVNDADYVTYLADNTQFHESHEFNVETQTFAVTRTFADESDFNTFVAHVSSNFNIPSKTAMESKGWTVSTTFHTV